MAFRSNFFKKFAIVLFAVFILNALANLFFWYESFFWFDMMMHFLGGVAGGLFLVWAFNKTYLIWREEKNLLKIVLLNSLLFLIVAVLWEIMEFSLQDIFNIGHALATLPDSISDVLCGLIGNFVALVYFFVKYSGNRNLFKKYHGRN